MAGDVSPVAIFKLEPKIVIVIVLRTEEHLEFSLLQNDPEHCILMFGSVLKKNSS